jgi:recombination protein RecA
MSSQTKNEPSVAPAEAWGGWDTVVPTGSLALDLALGTGGWPRGRVVEVFGPEGCGKTTLLLEAIAHVQRNGGFGALIDADHGTSPAALQRVGIDVEALPLHRTNSLEEAFEKVEELVAGGAVDVIALDSVGALLSDDDRRGGLKDVPMRQNVAHQHKVEYYLKSLIGPLSRSRAVLLVSNYVVEKIGVMFGNPETTPWETTPLRNYASVRVELRRLSPIKERDEALGYEVRARALKSRLAAPLVQAEFELLFASGICSEADLLRLGVETGVLTKRGGTHTFGEVRLGVSRNDALRRLKEDADLSAQVRAAIVERRRG